MWRRRGRRLLVHTPGKNVRVAVCGALRYPKGPFLFTHGPKSVHTDLFIALLNKLVRRARRTGKRIILVLDNGGCFTSKRSSQALHAARRWVTPIFLPKYTSETLNWIEGFWGHTKGVLAPHGSARIGAQSGTFSLHGANVCSLDSYAPLRPFITKIFIPFSVTATIKATLATLGMTKGFIYADLDSIAADIVEDEAREFAAERQERLKQLTED